MAQVSAQVISTVVYQSPDEAYEALLEGEIDSAQYVDLLELMMHQVEPDSRWLLDKVPNLTSFDSTSLSVRTQLQQDQLRAFKSSKTTLSARRLRVKYRYFQDMDKQDRFGYRFSTDITLSEYWQASSQIRREFSGRERVVSRSLTYNRSDGMIHQMRFGSFRTRLGLGSVYGYRGNLMEYSDDLDSESLLYPDFGGYNGLSIEGSVGDNSFELLGSITRDSAHALQTAGGMVVRNMKNWHSGLIFSANRLRNRNSETYLTDLKLALYNKVEYADGYLSAEITQQRGDGGTAGALVAEGKHHFELATIKYAFWSYGGDFLNLNSGSKAAYLGRTVEDEQTGFSYTDRLSGQTGGLLKTLVKLASDWEMTTSAIVGFRGGDSTRMELLSSIKHICSERVSLRVDYLARQRRSDPSEQAIRTNQRSRMEARLNLGRFKARSYIGYTGAKDGADYWSFFGNVRFQIPGMGEIEIWSNMGRIRHGSLEYWYFYVKHNQELWESMVLSVKVADSFSLSREDRHRLLLSVEMVAGL